jgi:hypothetical protein
MLGQLSISFCDTCNEFGMVSVVDGKLMIQYCDCEVETLEGEQNGIRNSNWTYRYRPNPIRPN